MDSAADNHPHASRQSRSGRLGRDEMNLAEFPITLLTDRVPKDQNEGRLSGRNFRRAYRPAPSPAS